MPVYFEEALLLGVARCNVRFGDETPGRLYNLMQVPPGESMLPARGDRELSTWDTIDAAKVAQIGTTLGTRVKLTQRFSEVMSELETTENRANPLLDKVYLPVDSMDDVLFHEMLDFIKGFAYHNHQKDVSPFTDMLPDMRPSGQKKWFLFNMVFRAVVSPQRSVSAVLLEVFRFLFVEIEDFCQMGITGQELFAAFVARVDLLPVECALWFK